MAILVGIDEAGFGPILGPLVVSSSTFRVPDNLVWANLWEILRKSVGERRAGLHGRLLIADSKKAFTRSVGLKHLQKTVLAVLSYLGSESQNLIELILALCPDTLEHLREYPWYQRLDDYLLGVENAGSQIGAAMLKADFDNKGVELLGLQSRILEVAYYNKMIEAVKNKAKVLFTAVAELMQGAIDQFKNETIEIIVDRQGGRSHYRRELQLMFEGSQLRVIHEDQDRSSYELTEKFTAEHAESAEKINNVVAPNGCGYAARFVKRQTSNATDTSRATDRRNTQPSTNVSRAGRKIRVHFIVGADDKFLPVSLASMASKYLRELLVIHINEYFRGFNSSVRPTAGYWKDGLRFIADLKTHIPNVKYDANQLIRCR